MERTLLSLIALDHKQQAVGFMCLVQRNKIIVDGSVVGAVDCLFGPTQLGLVAAPAPGLGRPLQTLFSDLLCIELPLSALFQPRSSFFF